MNSTINNLKRSISIFKLKKKYLTIICNIQVIRTISSNYWYDKISLNIRQAFQLFRHFVVRKYKKDLRIFTFIFKKTETALFFTFFFCDWRSDVMVKQVIFIFNGVPWFFNGTIFLLLYWFQGIVFSVSLECKYLSWIVKKIIFFEKKNW